MYKSPAITWLASAALLLGSAAGCARFSVPDKLKLPGQDDKPQTPLRMTALWTDTVLVEAGVVGFGGRILFYGHSQDDPIMVDGELTVFAYDDTSQVLHENVPARKFVFRTEEFSKHYSKSALGHSYSFWIPWDKVGGRQRQISLIARFKSAKGGVVMSEMTRHLLPGSGPEERLATRPNTPADSFAAGAALARVHQPASAKTSGAGLATTTITLPETMSAATRSVPADEDSSQAFGVATPGAAMPHAGTARTPAAGSTDASEIQALVRELRAMREQQEPSPAAQPADRFARRTLRARIEPKSPPTRDPAR
jgi:hypothetical protein